MNPGTSTPSIYQPLAVSAGLHGMMCHFTVITRPWLTESRKATTARQDETVIG